MGLGIDAYSQPYVTGVSGAGSYANTQAATGETKSEKAAAESGATVEFSDEGKKALENSQETGDKVVKSESAASKIAAKTNSMTESQRSELVAKLQSDQEARHNQLLNMVQKLFNKQANTYGQSIGQSRARPTALPMICGNSLPAASSRWTRRPRLRRRLTLRRTATMA